MARPDPEGDTLLRLAWIGITADQVRQLIARPAVLLDLGRLLDLGAMNGVLPLLHRNLEKAPGILPPPHRDRLRASYLRTCAANMIHAGRVARIVRLLEGAGIAVIPLKGSVGAADLFGDMGLYPTGDIDILVRPADLDRAEAILGDAGYHALPGMSREDLVRCYHHLHLRDEQHIIELHWNLSRSHLKVPPEYWWEGARRIPFEGATVLTMAPERQLLFAAIHLLSHGFRPLKFWAYLAALIKRYGDDIDPAELHRQADALGIGRLLNFVLTFAAERMGVDADRLLTKSPIPGRRVLDALVRSGLVLPEVRVNPRMIIYVGLLRGPRRALGIIGGKLFPRPAELRLRYGLTRENRRWWLYYLANPFLMAAGRK